ncbi:MAG: D-2-hydroxyacid dehydrogenase [Clostridia bacterium]|nr:D-2-hydroxyacid dehydrogenase [Clostridia bacterium]
MKIVILDGFAENPGDLSWDGIRAFGDVTVYDRTPKDAILTRAAGAEILVTNKTPLTKETLAHLPDVKFIALLSTGYNIVDCAYAKQRGIPVSNIPAYSTESVAQLVFALILEHTRQVGLHSRSVAAGDWAKSADFCYTLAPLTDLTGKTLGIIGYGSIGKAVARIALALGMRVKATSRTHTAGGDGGVTFCDLDTLIATGDIVSLHCPLTPETTGLVNRDFLRKMKPAALLINTSRGPVVDEQALADALNRGEIAGAGLDVMAQEPPQADNPLFTAKNCFITPHIAWAAYETRQRLMDVFTANIAAYIHGTPINVVNP